MVIGIQGAIAAIGLVAGPTLGGLLVHGSEWQWVFLINVPIGILAFILSLWFIQPQKCVHGVRVDWTGLVTLTIGLAMIILGLNFSSIQHWMLLAFLAAGIGMLISFFFIESHVKDPLLDLHLIHNLPFVMGCLSYFLFSFALFGSQPYWSLFLQNFWNFSPLEAGLAFLPATILIAVLTPLAGTVTHRYVTKLRYLLFIGIALVCVSFLYVTFLNVHSTYTSALLPSLILRGFGIPIITTGTLLAVMNAVNRTNAGLASGSWNMSRNIGTSLGVAVLGKWYSTSVSAKLETTSDIPLRSMNNLVNSAQHFMITGPQATRYLASSAVVKGFADISMICLIICAIGLILAVLIRNA